MDRIVDRAIILSRINYGEKDRIITVLGKDQGRVSVLAKSVRTPKSKLAGGVELLSDSTITMAKGRGDLYILTSSRLNEHYQNITSDYARLTIAYNFLKVVSKITEVGTGSELFKVLQSSLGLLNNQSFPKELAEIWFNANVLNEVGCSPNTKTNTNGEELKKSDSYLFDFDNQCFRPSSNGRFTQNHIKFMRIMVQQKSPEKLTNIKGSGEYAPALYNLFSQLMNYHFGL